MREYTVMINGLPHTMQLDDDDAKRYAAQPVTKQATPSNKARKPADKGTDGAAADRKRH